jgi:hypothetical protein
MPSHLSIGLNLQMPSIASPGTEALLLCVPSVRVRMRNLYRHGRECAASGVMN